MQGLGWRSLAAAMGMVLALLAGCDDQRIAKLEEGIATEADVRREFGEPALVVEKADGAKWLEYPRQPEGTTNHLIVIGADGRMASLRQLLTPDNIARVQPGMALTEVRQLLGRPAREQRYAMKPGEVEWQWRYTVGPGGMDRKRLSVTFDQDSRVLSVSSQSEPEGTAN